MSTPTPSRRGVLTGAAALTAAGYTASSVGPAAAAGHDNHSTRLTILGTTDLHGNVFNWDYYKNAEYDDAAHNDIGIAKVQTLIKAQRERIGSEPAARPRRRRHHPGNAARLLLRQDRADHLRRHAPDGQRHEPDRVRRGSARQPRVQLRHPAAPYLRAAADLPAARRQRGRPGHRPAGVHAVHRQEVPDAAGSGPQGRHPRAHQPGHRDLGPRQRRRGRSTSPVWSSRRRSSCRS